MGNKKDYEVLLKCDQCGTHIPTTRSKKNTTCPKCGNEVKV